MKLPLRSGAGRLRASLAAFMGIGPFLGLLPALSAPGCDKNQDSVVCKSPAVTCVAADAAPPRLDGTLPIPVQDCIAAAATEILVTQAKVGALAQQNGTDPGVTALGKQMNDDFTAAGADLHAAYQSLAIAGGADCPEVHQAAAIVEPALTTLQGLSGTEFDRQFATLEAAALDQARDFYNSALVANANSGNFKDLLRQERWRLNADGGSAVLKVTSCPAPTQSDGGGPTCLGVVPEWLAVVALAGPAGPDASTTDPDAASAGADGD